MVELKRKNFLFRKGFLESYDVKVLFEFLNDIKLGKERVEVFLYFYFIYDREEGVVEVVEGVDIVIIEGINVLQLLILEDDREDLWIFVLDFFDFLIYVDVEESWIFMWYLECFCFLREIVFQDLVFYFYKFKDLFDVEVDVMVVFIWESVNCLNLYENILLIKFRLDLILRKGDGYKVEEVLVRWV